LEELSISQLRERLESGQASSRELIQDFLASIESLDRNGPALNSIIEVNPDALEIAETLDRERAAGQVRGPLHGIPMVVKDNIDTGDRMQTTAGSLAMIGQPAPRDAFVVRRLREAGAVILAKSNLSEWANFRSTNSTSGWSGRGGQTKNPNVLNRNPSGSSSGSGTAVAANLAAAALGTETNGSIVSPAGTNGIVGIKPTVGLTSRSGVVPISHTQDVVGPMARTVADAAAVLSAIAGYDPDDQVTEGARGQPHDYTRFLDPDGLRGARIGVVRNLGFDKSPAVDRAANAAVDEMRRLGAVIVDVELPEAPEGSVMADASTVMLYEFKAGLNRYLQRRGSTVNVHSLADVIEFNQQHAEQELCYFGQERLLQAEEKGDLDRPEYREALEKIRRTYRDEGIDRLLAEHTLQALVAPTNAPVWLTDLVNGDHFGVGSSTPAAIAGYPSITVPAGYAFELPIGISFFGPAYSEPTLIKLTSGFEHQTQARRRPRFLPQVP